MKIDATYSRNNSAAILFTGGENYRLIVIQDSRVTLDFTGQDDPNDLWEWILFKSGVFTDPAPGSLACEDDSDQPVAEIEVSLEKFAKDIASKMVSLERMNREGSPSIPPPHQGVSG